MPVPINTGDTAWLMIASSLVLLMIPALGMFEAGLLRQKNAVSVFMQIFFGLALLSVMWFTVGFSLTFGPDTGEGLTGNMDWRFLKGVSQNEGLHYAPTVPGVSFAMFQMMFAVITPLILTGAIAERMKFSAYVLFIVAWSALIYYPLVHWIWGEGWLHKLGVADFAGGMIIHTTTGVGGIAAALVLGRRLGFGPGIMVPHNIPLAVLGSSLIWLGWFGFNAGSAYSAGSLSGVTIVNTQMASAVSALIWVTVFWIRTRKSSVIAAINGAVAGLAGITAASGYVSVEYAVVIGIIVGFASSLMVPIFKEKLKIDDALDIGAVHGVSGKTGPIFHTSGQTSSDDKMSTVDVPMPVNYTGPITIAFENLNGNSFADSEFPGVVSNPTVVPEFEHMSILVLMAILMFIVIITRTVVLRKNHTI